MQYVACVDDPPAADYASCLVLELVEPPAGFLPPLSIEDAGALLVAVCGVLAIAWVYKQLRRAT